MGGVSITKKEYNIFDYLLLHHPPGIKSYVFIVIVIGVTTT